MAQRWAALFLHRGWLGALCVLSWLVLATAAGALLWVGFADHLRADIREEVARPFKTLNQTDTEFDLLTDKIAARGGISCSDQDRTWIKTQIFGMLIVQDVVIHDGTAIRCTALMGQFAEPIQLGKGDRLERRGKVRMLWSNFALDALGYSNKMGSLQGFENYALLTPRLREQLTERSWLGINMVVHHDDGRFLFQYAAVTKEPNNAADTIWSLYGRLNAFTLQEKACLRSGLTCMVGTLPVGEALHHHKTAVLAGLLAAVLFGVFGAYLILRAIRWRWSFAQRFRRHLTMDTVKCVYQPMVDPITGKIIGCEVLARWEDVDGTTVFPDVFIPVVAQAGLTRGFTDLLIRKALSELTEVVTAGPEFKISINLFPRDIDGTYLGALLCNPDLNPKGFRLYVEIVETEDLDVGLAYAELTALRERGVGVFMDDFGVGYSNLEHIVSLPLDGIKIDRCFAMAPAGSLRNAMLPVIIDMARRSGRRVVVEGIETEDRLNQMSALQVDAVQGYFISKPVDKTGLASFIAGWGQRVRALRRAA